MIVTQAASLCAVSWSNYVSNIETNSTKTRVYPCCACLSMNPDDLLLLVTREMPFGKHKGRLIADLPGNYLNWFAREGFPKGEIGRLVALMHEIDHNGLASLLQPLRMR